MPRREFLKLAAAGTVGLACSQGFAEESPKRPNILLLMTDQHRADCLGCAGNKVIRTPNLDRLAREGAYFPNAYSTTPTCTPARSALLTGMSPWHHGMLGFGQVAERYPVELPRALNDAGYYTFAIGKLHYFPQRNYHGFQGALVDESGRVQTPGFISDYRKWFKEQAPDLDPDATRIGFNDHRAKSFVLPEELHPTSWMGRTAVDFIENYNRPEPLFLKVSFARPHSPYDPPKRFMDAYREQDMPAPHVGDWADKHSPTVKDDWYTRWHGDLGLDQARKSRRGYYGSVSFIDEQVGLILKALELRGMLENTLILMTADHGDMLGDHHLWRKSYAHDGSARIPMIIRPPKTMAVDRGVTLRQTVEIRDILPTSLDTAGAKIPDSVDGQSMLPLLRGESGWREYLDLEHAFCYDAQNNWNGLTDGRYKYIFHAFDAGEQLFDLQEDPGELRDLAGDPSYSRTLSFWRNRLVKHMSERTEDYVRDGKLMIRKEKALYSPNFPGKVG